MFTMEHHVILYLLLVAASLLFLIVVYLLHQNFVGILPRSDLTSTILKTSDIN